MSPPVALTKRWKKIKKRCSFSSSDRLVRSKSFTEHDTSEVSHEAPVIIDHVPGQYADKYLTVGSRDANRFQGLRDKIAQWNSDLKKRRSTENLSPADQQQVCHERSRGEHAGMFVVASPTSGVHPVKSAVISPTVYSTASLKTPNRKSSSRVHLSPWSSPSPSPPSPSSDDLSDNQRNDSYTSQHSLYQDQDSGYDGFCPEKSIYSTGSSDTSSVMSSEGRDTSHINIMESLYARSRPRPRPAPIYEKHCDYGGQYGGDQSSGVGHGQYGTLSRAHIAQATVVNLVKSQPSDRQLPRSPCHSADQPPPLPPRPVSGAVDPPLPLPASKPKSKVIMSGAISLPRRRDQFKESARRRGSYHDAFNNNENSGAAADNDLYIEAEDKAASSQQGSKFCTLPRQRKSQSYSIKNVTFEKGPGKKSLGFTVVGGKDSPKGSIGIYVKSIFPNGQALGMLKEGDEIFSVNGRSVAGLTHSEAIGIFKETKVGAIQVTLGRRESSRKVASPPDADDAVQC